MKMIKKFPYLRPKSKQYRRVCKRCSRIYETPYRHSKFCDKCVSPHWSKRERKSKLYKKGKKK